MKIPGDETIVCDFDLCSVRRTHALIGVLVTVVFAVCACFIVGPNGLGLLLLAPLLAFVGWVNARAMESAYKVGSPTLVVFRVRSHSTFIIVETSRWKRRLPQIALDYRDDESVVVIRFPWNAWITCSRFPVRRDVDFEE